MPKLAQVNYLTNPKLWRARPRPVADPLVGLLKERDVGVPRGPGGPPHPTSAQRFLRKFERAFYIAGTIARFVIAIDITTDRRLAIANEP